MTKRPCLAIIPAKGTSQRFPKKNLAALGGISLVRRAFDCAEASGVFESILVSSESEACLLQVPPGNWSFGRPAILSEPGVPASSVVHHVLALCGYYHPSFAVLWPTFPLRSPEQIAHVARRFFAGDAEALWTTTDGRHDGNVIFCTVPAFLRQGGDCWEAMKPVAIETAGPKVDVDTAEDFAMAEGLWALRASRP